MREPNHFDAILIHYTCDLTFATSFLGLLHVGLHPQNVSGVLLRNVSRRARCKTTMKRSNVATDSVLEREKRCVERPNGTDSVATRLPSDQNGDIKPVGRWHRVVFSWRLGPSGKTLKQEYSYQCSLFEESKHHMAKT